MSRVRYWGFWLPILAYTLALVIGELILRSFGYDPTITKQTGQIGGHFVPEPITGWRLAETSPEASSPGPKITVWPGGRRATSSSDPFLKSENSSHASKLKQIVFLGGSFTEGAGLSDSETCAWLVQSALPDWTVTNFGTGGQGGCQSLLRMRTLLDENTISKSVFIYGFFAGHEARNVADPLYAWKIARASKLRTAFMPYCWIDEQGGLLFKPPETFRFKVPLSETLAIGRLIEETYYEVKAWKRRKRQREVTELILLRMKANAEGSENRFLVLTMRFDPELREHYSRFFTANKIEYVDGYHPKQNEREYQLSDGHPNAAMSSFWADKVVDYLKQSGGTNYSNDR